MFPKLNIKLENKTSYINTGNFFSKSLIIKENLKAEGLNSLQKIVLIIDSDKSLNQYKKVFDYLKINYRELDNYASLCDLAYNNYKGIFLVLNYKLKDEIVKESQLLHFSLILEKGSLQNINNIVKKLSELGYKFSDYSNNGTYKKSGDILNIVSFCGNIEYKISFWGEVIEEILENNIAAEKIIIGGSKNIFNDDIKKESNLQNYLKNLNRLSTEGFNPLNVFIILDSLDFSEFYEENTKILNNFCSFDFVGNKSLEIKDLEIKSPVIENIDNLKEILNTPPNPPLEGGIFIYTKNFKTITNFIDYNELSKGNKITEISGSFLKSFELKSNTVGYAGLHTLQIICDDILGKIFIKKRINKNISADLDLLLKINIGDFVVHIDHGIGIFKGIIKKELPTKYSPLQRGARGGTIIKEYIEINYKGEDRLFVPITEVSRVNKYVGADNPKLTGLNTSEWTKKLAKASQEVEDIAQELLEIYSARKMGKSFSFLPDINKENDFRASFPYTYTIDQEVVIGEILGDMELENPMDRLLVGDVGFGKTEVAFVAIYRAFLNKKQSIFIAPLVVLAYEHYEKAVERFKPFGMKIAVITRMESAKKVEEVLNELDSGEIDLVIGTHKLLSDKINYKNLGLLIVDEEHKFGVKDKEKIKKLKSTIDILSMSATPIPRSLNMALSQIKQMSIIKTAPFGRQDIKTTISKYSERVILDGCEAEFKRGGQVYFVHNRIATLVHFEKILQGLFPDKKIITTHGQLPGNSLEKRIIDFKHKKYDILLTTTVIENGIDFPNVNTIFINDAPIFGISQIHQLRGRVGRSDRSGHCFLLYKKESLSEETAKRLKTIVNFSYLGAGFELAMKDLEIRGGGDLLGSKQSGQGSEIGINLYLKMIEEKVNELKMASPHSVSSKEREVEQKFKINTKIDLNINFEIPDEYFDSDLDKINFYREIETINSLEVLDEVINDFKETNNIKIFPELMQNFFNLLKVKLKAGEYLITNIKKNGINYQLDFDKNINLDKLRRFLQLDKEVKFVVITPQRLRCSIKDFTNPEKFLEYLGNIFDGNIGKRKIKLKK